MKKSPTNLAKSTQNTAQKATQKVKKTIEQTKNSQLGEKVKQVTKKSAKIIGSHLALLRTSLTLSNEEAELLEKLKDDLNKKGIYPAKSEIVRAALWNLRKMNPEEIAKAIKDLVTIKQTRVL